MDIVESDVAWEASNCRSLRHPGLSTIAMGGNRPRWQPFSGSGTHDDEALAVLWKAILIQLNPFFPIYQTLVIEVSLLWVS